MINKVLDKINKDLDIAFEKEKQESFAKGVAWTYFKKENGKEFIVKEYPDGMVEKIENTKILKNAITSNLVSITE